jgi:hypothetical protein
MITQPNLSVEAGDAQGGTVVEVTTVDPVVGGVVGGVVGVVVGAVVAVVVEVVVVVGVVQPVPFSIHGPPTRPCGWVSNTNTNLMSTCPAKHGVVTDSVAVV